jgi:hypothetical protein
MDTSNINNKVKDNWDDSSESEPEYENGRDVNNNNNSIDPLDELLSKCNENKNDDIEEENELEEEWDFYDGYSACINCGKSDNHRIIIIESKRVFCYDACLENDDDDDDGGYDDYDLDDYDKKLGLSVSCRR